MHIIISTLKTTVRIIRSRREATNTCSAWCSYCSRAHDRHWQSFITFYQWGQSQAQNSLTYNTRQPVPIIVCNCHKLGTQEIISVISCKNPQNAGYNWRDTELVFPLIKYKWKSQHFQSIGKWSESVSCSLICDSLRPHGLQPTRLHCPWDSPGKNTWMHIFSLCWEIPMSILGLYENL